MTIIYHNTVVSQASAHISMLISSYLALTVSGVNIAVMCACTHATLLIYIHYDIIIAHSIADSRSNRVWHRNFEGKEILGDLHVIFVSPKKLAKNW